MAEKKPVEKKVVKDVKDVPSQQAIGDGAAAAGMALVSGGAMANTLEDIENQTRDYIALYAKRTGALIDIWVQTAAPAHKVDRIWGKKST